MREPLKDQRVVSVRSPQENSPPEEVKRSLRERRVKGMSQSRLARNREDQNQEDQTPRAKELPEKKEKIPKKSPKKQKSQESK